MIQSSAGGTSFYTAPTHAGTTGSVVYSFALRSGVSAARNAKSDDSNTVATESGAAHRIPRAPTPSSPPESQHQGWMASLASQQDMQSREPNFASGDTSCVCRRGVLFYHVTECHSVTTKDKLINGCRVRAIAEWFSQGQLSQRAEWKHGRWVLR